MVDATDQASPTVTSVTGILTNWRRPENLERIIPAVRGQVDKLILVDNSPDRGQCSRHLWDRFDNVFSATGNLGPSCRFLPLGHLERTDFILWLDDDLLPGPRAVWGLVEQARDLGGAFSIIGEIGRIHGERGEYVSRNIKRPLVGMRKRVDMTCRAHFVRFDLAHRLPMIREEIVRLSQLDRIDYLLTRHDDILLCQGLQWSTGLPTYLSAERGREACLKVRNLPSRHAASMRPGHEHERTDLVREFLRLGWRSHVRKE